MSKCKCEYTLSWDQEYERIEYKYVGGERFQGRLNHLEKGVSWNAKASDGAVNPPNGTGRNASTNLEPSSWKIKTDWKKKGGPKNQKKDPLSTCARCKPIGVPELVEPGDPIPGNETPGEPQNVTVTFTANYPESYPPTDTDSANCKTRERKNKRTDKYKQKYSCES